MGAPPSGVGRANKQNVIHEKGGPTSYARRSIIADDTSSVFSLFIDNFIINHIKICTEAEAREKTGNATGQCQLTIYSRSSLSCMHEVY